MSEHIINIEKYCNDMSKSMKEKMFWIHRINPYWVRGVVDFGCADGTMLKIHAKHYPYVFHVGIDNNPEMLRKADQNGIHNLYTSIDEFLFSNKTSISAFLNTKNSLDLSHYVIVFSSVIHELFSYLPYDEIRNIVRKVEQAGFGYICIRDMSSPYFDYIEPANPAAIEYIKEKTPKLWSDFENRWVGKPNPYVPDKISKVSNMDLAHFLMKYKYEDNWQRELNENYLPISTENLLWLFLNDNVESDMVTIPNKYTLLYINQYPSDYLKKSVLDDYGIDLQLNTHAKIILRRKDIPENDDSDFSLEGHFATYKLHGDI